MAKKVTTTTSTTTTSVTVPGTTSVVSSTVVSGGGSITSVEQSTLEGAITDITIVPYMRQQLIYFNVEGMRPNRRIFFFFDDFDISDNIIEADMLVLQQNASNVVLNAGFSNNDVLTVSSGNTAFIQQQGQFIDYTTDTGGIGVARKRVLKVTNVVGEMTPNVTFSTSRSGNTGKIQSVIVKHGDRLDSFFTTTTSNTLTLPIKTKHVANNYWGTDGSNTISLFPIKGRDLGPMVCFIRGFDNTTRTLSLSSNDTVANLRVDYPSNYMPGLGTTDNVITWAITKNREYYTDEEGKFSGGFLVPGEYFRNGERIFSICDDYEGVRKDSSTYAEYKFISSGLTGITRTLQKTTTTTQQLPVTVSTSEVAVTTEPSVVTTTSTETTRTVVRKPDPKPKPPPTPPFVWPRGNDGGKDPIGQTFFIDVNGYPNGVFLTAVELYFKTVDALLPISVELRRTVNGYPESSGIIAGSYVALSPEFVNTSTDASLGTKFTFGSPVFLPPGMFSVIVQSDSPEYECYVSEVGGTIIGTNRKVSKNPNFGSLVKSENSFTWNANQTEDLMMKLYKANFSGSATVVFDNVRPDVDAFADATFTHIEDTVFKGTTINYAHSFDSGSTYLSYIPDTKVIPNTGRLTFANSTNGQYKIRATMSTTDNSISPVLYSSSGYLLALENYIDNANIDAQDIVITNGGTGYAPNSNITITLTSSNGTGAVVHALGNTDGSGTVTTIIVPEGGYQYISNISFASANGNTGTSILAAGGTGATLSINTELSPSGGPAIAKYISRPVTLAEGFDAGDLRVFLTAYKPSGTNLHVYYKIKNVNDTDQFDTKNYFLMKQKTLNTLYSKRNNFDDVIEYEFEPFDSGNAISYSTATATYTTFNQFSIKVVATTDDTTQVPVWYDLRAIALPAMDT